MAPVKTSQRSLESWRRNAACNGTHTDLFFPVGEVGEEPVRQAEEAKVVCFACPVREECLEYALATDQPFGIWGGTTEAERRAIKRRRRRRPAVAS
jgi:WhiB family redox-sensing transcriptional regulator